MMVLLAVCGSRPRGVCLDPIFVTSALHHGSGQSYLFAGYASRQGYVLVDQRLFLPEVWFGPLYAARRVKCQVPAELQFQTKPQLAAAMLQSIRQEGILPFRYIVADSVYGNSPDFLAALDACVGTTALVAISSETRCWPQRPTTQEKAYRYKGEAPSAADCSRPAERRSAGGDPASVAVVSADSLGRDQGADCL